MSDPAASTVTQQTPLEVLEHVFGFRAFRGRQDEVIGHILGGGDAVVLMPTGGGKSLCFQIPALLRAGTGIVVSPLIALMQDQVAALRQNGVRAAFLNSTLTADEARDVREAYLAGELDLLYLAPERLLREETLAMLARGRVALIAIDEAHCVSQWGHDFRPEYLELAVLADRFPGAPRLALTATANPQTRDEIAERLRMPDAKRFVSGFDRPNIRYAVGERTRPRRQLLAFLEGHRGRCGIVYCTTRKDTEKYAAVLREAGHRAEPYHAGLDDGVRAETLRRFQAADDLVVVATIAFGMGVDKPDVRFVAHLNLPKSLEAYYQETGRAGRDGEPAEAWMVYGLDDVILQRRFIDESDGADAYKRMAHQRLNALLAYCELAGCRRRALLAYFGDDHPPACDNCDACLDPPETLDATVAAQKALSCVYRTGERFGAGHLTDVLLGGDTEKIRRFGHERLSTHGIGDDLDRAGWRSLFRQLVMAGACDVDAEGYGTLRLNATSWRILRGEEPFRMRKRRPKAKRKGRRARAAAGATGSAPADLDALVDDDLFEALRAFRQETADAQGVPPYVVFHDSTLRGVAALRPRTEAELLEVSGVGERKLARYGAEVLAVVAAHLDGADAPPPADD